MPTWADNCDLESLGFSSALAGRIRRDQPSVLQAAKENGVHPAIINAVAFVESRFIPTAVSSAGAKGVMQLMPKTFEALQKRVKLQGSPFDPHVSITLGAFMLGGLLRRWKGNVDLALASYFAGVGNVQKLLEKHGQLPRSGPKGSLAGKVANYVRAVKKQIARFSTLFVSCTLPASDEPDPEPTVVDVPPRQSFPIIRTPAQQPAQRPRTSSSPVLFGGVGIGVVLLAMVIGLTREGSRRAA